MVFCALQVPDLGQEIRELVKCKVHIVAVVILVEQHNDTVDFAWFVWVVAQPLQDLHRWLVDPHVVVGRIVNVQRGVVLVARPPAGCKG
jgi:hypothetical protein